MKICVTEKALKHKDYAKLWNTACKYQLGGVSLSLPDRGALSEEEMGQIKMEVRRTNIPLVSLRLSLKQTIFSSLGHILPNAVRVCGYLECPSLTLQTGGFFQENGEEVIDLFRPALSAALSEAQGKGVCLLVEGPVSKAFMHRLTHGKADPFLGVSMDLATAYWYGMDPLQELEGLEGWVKQIVCNDLRAMPGDCRVGKGFVDYAGVNAFLSKGNSPVDWCVLDGPPGLPEQVGRDSSYLRYAIPALRVSLRWPVFGAMSYEFPYTAGEIGPLIENLKRKRIEYVQVGGTLLAEILENPERADEIKKQLEAEGIFFVGVAAYKNLVARDPEKRAQNLELMKKYLEVAPQLGASPVATETGTFNPDHDFRHSPRNFSEEAWKELYRSLDELVSVAEKHHSCIALEGYVNNIIGTLPHIQKVLMDYPTDAIQLVSDPCNFLHSKLLPVQERITQSFVDRFEDRLILAHIKDVKSTGAETGTPGYGEGVFNISPYLRFLYHRRPDLPLILEHQPSEQVPIVMERVLAKVSDLINGSKERS